VIVAKQSAGILIYRRVGDELQVLLVHPGGPYFKSKELGAWSIPKGEFTDNEDPATVAVREVEEETGYVVTSPLTPLSPIKQKGGKRVQAWAAEGDLDPAAIVSNTFELEWPPRSGRTQEFPEVDRAGWFTPDQARDKIIPAQFALVEELIKRLGR
jgi:predicted NUDIX family NTP pyrophosphohydrolase